MAATTSPARRLDLCARDQVLREAGCDRGLTARSGSKPKTIRALEAALNGLDWRRAGRSEYLRAVKNPDLRLPEALKWPPAHA